MKRILIYCLILPLVYTSCKESAIPKPKGYFRIALPERSYLHYDSTAPYHFDYPAYATIENQNNKGKENWINMVFPKLNGTLHFTYKPILNKDELSTYINDAFKFASKHIQKASGINEELFINDSARVYGLIYHIEGINTATTYQFFLTDSTKHFIRGALYFNSPPNNDSLAPVINFIKEDMDVVLSSFQWKE